MYNGTSLLRTLGGLGLAVLITEVASDPGLVCVWEREKLSAMKRCLQSEVALYVMNCALLCTC